MPVNRNALIRYKTIDRCLQNRYRKWTLEDLIDACSDSLYEYEGILKGISRRTVQLDIQMMRSDKLGYNAPIVVYDNKYYTYSDESYSITNIPITDQDLGQLSEAVEFLKQFKGFSHFQELDSMVQKLEDHVYSQKTRQKPVIDFEKNENLKGLEFLDSLYRAIIRKKAIKLTYQSFKARQASCFDFHAYLLKEFRNRWFLIGVKKAGQNLLTLALDRILGIEESSTKYVYPKDFEPEEYFKNAIGVSVSPYLKPEKVILFVTHKHAPYVITKPMHSSQKIVERDGFGITVELQVQHNFELEKEILGLGDGVMVIAPEKLKRCIKERLNGAIDSYNTSISEKGIISVQRKLTHKGFAVVSFMYSLRSLKQLGSILHKSSMLDDSAPTVQKIAIGNRPDIETHLLNKNVMRIIKLFPENISFSEIEFHGCISDDSFIWGQEDSDEELCMTVFLSHKKIDSFPIQLIPGSHNKIMPEEQQSLIIANSLPSNIELYSGSALLMKPKILKRFSESMKGLNVKFFLVRFNRVD